MVKSETTRRAVSPDMAVLDSRVYRGPGIWSYAPAIHLVVDLGNLEDHPSNVLAGFTDQLLTLLPGLERHTCSGGIAGGFVARLREGTKMGHVAEHVSLQVQVEVGQSLHRGKTRQVKGKPGIYDVVYGYVDERVGLAAGRLAVRLVNHLVQPEPDFDFPSELNLFVGRAQRVAFGPSTSAILEEAVSRDIPWIRLNEQSLIQLGQGVHAKRIRATMTSGTSALAVDIADDKGLTAKLLASAGLPVPRSKAVRSVQAAIAAAGRIGYPCVLKPLDANHGHGVCLNLSDADAVRAAWPIAERESRQGTCLVESLVIGRDYRCLIVGGKMAAIAERVPAHVIGDGRHAIAELIEVTNSDPRRRVGHKRPLTKITVDASAVAVLKSQGFDLASVAPAGAVVRTALMCDLSAGGISVDRTFDAHPDNVDIAEEAARMIGLDVAGVDFICPDIAMPVRETGGAICEVDAAPDFRMHTHPTVGEPQFIAKPVVDLLFPTGARSRVPIVAVTGTNGKTTTARMIAHIFKGLGRKVGMTSTDGIVIDGRLVIKADASGPKSARMVLQNPRVDFAVMEVARGGILREGLGFDRNDVAVVTNVAGDHLGLRGVNTLDQLADVKAVVVEAVPRNGFAVLNADDDLVRAMRHRCSGDIVWFSLQPPGTRVRNFVDERCRRGERAVVLEPTDKGDMIIIRHGRRSMQLAWAHLLPSTFGGAAKVNVANAMAAAGAAFAAGAPLHDIRQGLSTFTTTYDLSPGRMNLLNINSLEVVVDYCHNPPGMRMLGDFVESYTAHKAGKSKLGKSSRIGMIGVPGDRRDGDIREMGSIAAGHFDVLVVREDYPLRGRQPGIAAALVVEGAQARMAGGTARCRQVETVLDELAAVRDCMARAKTGDLVVLCVEQHQSVMDVLEKIANQAHVGVQRGNGSPTAKPTAINSSLTAVSKIA